MATAKHRSEDDDFKAFEAGAELHESAPDLLLAEVARRGFARSPDKEQQLWFLEGYKSARQVREAFLRERADDWRTPANPIMCDECGMLHGNHSPHCSKARKP